MKSERNINIICVAGKSGSGKSIFSCELAKALSCKNINIDEIAHYVLTFANVKSNIYKKFGKEVFDDNGEVNRKKLGKIVFENSIKRKYLMRITWKEMCEVLEDVIINEIKSKSENVVLDYMFLPQTKFWKKSLKIIVDATQSVRLERIKSRDGISEEDFLKREKCSPNFKRVVYDFLFDTSNMKSQEEIVENAREFISTNILTNLK